MMGDAARDAYGAETGLSGDELYSDKKYPQCPVCGKKFKKSVGIPDHIRDVHGGKQ